VCVCVKQVAHGGGGVVLSTDKYHVVSVLHLLSSNPWPWSNCGVFALERLKHVVCAFPFTGHAVVAGKVVQK